jgi:hypothetical protein
VSGAVPLATTERLAAAPTATVCEAGWVVMTGGPRILKLCRSQLVTNPGPDCLASNVTIPEPVGVTLKVPTPPIGLTIVTVPVEPATTVSVIPRPELAVGLTGNETTLTFLSAMAAKLTDWAPTARAAPEANKVGLVAYASAGPVAARASVRVSNTPPRLAISEMVLTPGVVLGFSRPRMVFPVPVASWRR